MTKKDINHVKEVLAVLIGQPLRELGRSSMMITLDFGELIEIDTIKQGEDGRPLRDENGRGIPTKAIVGKYGMHVLCGMRFTCGDEVIFARSDIFLPTVEQSNKPDFSWATFDWHTTGNTAFDEFVSRHFNGKFCDYIVKSIKVNKFGDLTIAFENGFMLELFSDNSDDSTLWNFGEMAATEDLLTITSNGIERTDD